MGMRDTLTALTFGAFSASAGVSQNQPDVLLPSKEAIAQKAEPNIQKIVENIKKM